MPTLTDDEVKTLKELLSKLIGSSLDNMIDILNSQSRNYPLPATPSGSESRT